MLIFFSCFLSFSSIFACRQRFYFRRFDVFPLCFRALFSPPLPGLIFTPMLRFRFSMIDIQLSRRFRHYTLMLSAYASH